MIQPRKERKDLDAYGPTLTFKEVAEILGVSKPTIYTMIHRGQLTPRRLGATRVGFSKREVVAQFGL